MSNNQRDADEVKTDEDNKLFEDPNLEDTEEEEAAKTSEMQHAVTPVAEPSPPQLSIPLTLLHKLE